MYIYILWLALGPPHQCQLLPGSDSHETRGGWRALQLLRRVRRPLHFHLHQLPKRGTRESQAIHVTVMLIRRKLLVILQGPMIRKTLQSDAFLAPAKTKYFCLLSSLLLFIVESVLVMKCFWGKTCLLYLLLLTVRYIFKKTLWFLQWAEAFVSL